MPQYSVFKVHPYTIIVPYITKYCKFLVRSVVYIHH